MIGNPDEEDEEVKSVAQTRRILIQAQAELKNEQKGNLNKNKAKIANVRENFSKNVKKYFWEAYLKDNEDDEIEGISYWNDHLKAQ